MFVSATAAIIFKTPVDTELTVCYVDCLSSSALYIRVHVSCALLTLLLASYDTFDADPDLARLMFSV